MSLIDSVLKPFQFEKLEKPVTNHLKNVYVTVALALLSCAVGGYMGLVTSIFRAGLLTIFGSLGVVIWLLMTPPTQENTGKRFGLLMVFSFLTGVNMGPLLNYVINIDPSIIPTAFLATSLIFICFTLSALLCDNTQFLALGGTLMSACSWLLLLSLLHLFTGSELLFQLNVYIGLVVFCGFILYDTQAIILKSRQGSDDFVSHALDLFIDFIGVFRRLLIILSDRSDRRRRDD